MVTVICGVLFLGGGDQPSLESVETPHQIRSQSFNHRWTQWCALLQASRPQFVDLLVEQQASRVELVKDALGQMCSRDACRSTFCARRSSISV